MHQHPQRSVEILIEHPRRVFFSAMHSSAATAVKKTEFRMKCKNALSAEPAESMPAEFRRNFDRVLRQRSIEMLV
jgi:hypothetical protein